MKHFVEGLRRVGTTWIRT